MASAKWKNPLFDPALLEHDRTAEQLERMLRRLAYDDALVCKGQRVEYLYPEQGFVYYCLKAGGLLMKVDVRSPKDLVEVQKNLAHCLVWLGFVPEETVWVEGGAETPYDANKRKMRRLF